MSRRVNDLISSLPKDRQEKIDKRFHEMDRALGFRVAAISLLTLILLLTIFTFNQSSTLNAFLVFFLSI